MSVLLTIILTVQMLSALGMIGLILVWVKVGRFGLKSRD